MTTVPQAQTRVSDTAGALAGGIDTICVICPVATNADTTPRQYGGAAAVYAQHGFSDGVGYVALHAQRTRKPVIFIGIPIVTPGVVGREDTSGNTGTSATTVTAGASGVLAEHDGVVRVAGSGTFTIGSSQVKLEVSADGGRTFKPVRLGTADSYVLPFFGVTVAFGAGTLVGGDVVHTWHGTAPRGDSDGWQAARVALAAQQRAFRSALLIGDLQTSTEANAFNTQLEAYETENERFVYGRASVRDRIPQAALSHSGQAKVTGSVSLTFDNTADTITRNVGSWIADGFVVGDWVTVEGGANDGFAAQVETVTALVLTFGEVVLVDEGPVSSATAKVSSSPAIEFVDGGGGADTITRSRGSWLDDGFRAGSAITVDGSDSNDTIIGVTASAVTASTITVPTGTVTSELLGVADGIGSFVLAITAGQSKAVWMADIDAAFAAVDSKFRIDLSAGRGRVLCPFSGWLLRRPAGWAASLREYAHDLHIATWKKEDGPVDFDLFSADRVLVEWDDRADGGAGSAARFTTLRTWANGPQGAFVTLSLTRADEGSLLSRTHNVAVVNLAQTVVQLNTENVVGRSLVLNDDGTATKDSLTTIEAEVNAALELALLQNRGKGPRASKAVMTCATDDILNVPEAELNTTTELNLNGTIHRVNNVIRVLSGGQ